MNLVEPITGNIHMYYETSCLNDHSCIAIPENQTLKHQNVHAYEFQNLFNTDK